LVGRLVFDETLVPRADVLASLASQKTNVEGGDLKRPERDVVFVPFPIMMQVLAPGGLVGGTAKVDGAEDADNALIGGDRDSGRDVEGLERGSGGGNEIRGGGERWNGGGGGGRDGGGRRERRSAPEGWRWARGGSGGGERNCGGGGR
jgi:hypothetical protein